VLCLLRSLVFLALQIVITPVFTLIALICCPLPALVRYQVISCWSKILIVALQYVCGIRYEVFGRENIPTQPCIILCKHQSAWETLALQSIFPPQVWVLKKELLWIPFFGWGLATLSPIAINRRAGTKALKHMAIEGKKRLAAGFFIVIFPEGTRVAPGKRIPYQPGGAWLARKTNCPVVPVAHNAGTCWPKNALIKYPGVIRVYIGKPIDPTGLSTDALLYQVENWIEEKMLTLSPHAKPPA